MQGVVLTDDVDQRLAGVALDKLANLAELTLPTQPTSNYQTLLDLERKVWVLSSRDPNLQVTTSFAGPVPGAPPSAPVYGFHVAMQRSVVQAVRYQGRWYLRDGYQRSIGLLGSGVRRVP